MKPTKQTISDDAVEREANEENDVSFIGRRKIIKGLSGAPFLLTFSHHSQGAVESFARCAQSAIDSYNSTHNKQKTLSAFNKVFSDGTDWWSWRKEITQDDGNGGQEFSHYECRGAEISDACLTSFDLGSSQTITKVTDGNAPGVACNDD
jgi:hypothetical protein